MGEASQRAPAPVVIDTNGVLDLFLFDDAAARPLRGAIEQGRVRWLALPAMRAELARVLGYPQLRRQIARRAVSPDGVLAAFDRWSCPMPEPARAPMACADPDDQIFIDLAFAAQASLLSKDLAVLALARRLGTHGIMVCTLGAWRPGPLET